jgi:putative FmdB family regulatory protein
VPTYVYQCKSCEVKSEKIQRITDAALKTCEDCGGELRKVMQPVAVSYNCLGFHRTDYPR